MRRLARHLFTLGSAVSLLLCVAACALWVRSLGRWDTLAWRVGDVYHLVESDRGKIVCYRIPPAPPTLFLTGYNTGQWHAGFAPAPRVGLMPLGFQYYHGPYPWQPRLATSVTLAGAPHAFIAAATAAGGLPALMSLNRLRRARARRRIGRCTSCGYDLRAHTGGGRCPECGTPPEPA